jgi:transcription antitermination factor NusG
MNPEPHTDQWYALQVRSRWESATATLLCGKGYQTLVPTYKAEKRLRTVSKEMSFPLFPGYVFCQFDVHNRLPILVTPGVLSVVGRGRTPIAVEDAEIEALQRVVSSGLLTEPWPFLEVGQRVRILDGALSGLEGILTSFRGSHRIVVSVSLLCRSVSVEIERSRIEATQSTRTVLAGSLEMMPKFDEGIA